MDYLTWEELIQQMEQVAAATAEYLERLEVRPNENEMQV